MFDEKDRALGGTTAPPHGLTLISVHYPDHPWADGKEPVIGGAWM
jgi:tRNA U38,U39,U40 pseudouridine synthase TruA